MKVTKRKLDVVFIALSFLGIAILTGTATTMYCLRLTTWYDHITTFKALYFAGGIFGTSPLMFDLVVETIDSILKIK